MNPEDLPITTPLINGHHDSLAKFSDLVSIKNKHCLCIGYDENQLKEYILRYNPKKVVLLTLWDDHKDNQIDDFETVVGDIGKRTTFKDSEFDFVITYSVLEHINDLENALIEIKRILKSDGYFVSVFGAAWSCHWGHHLYACPGNPLYDFCQWRMPSHIHLLSSLNEIFDFYRSKGATDSECATVKQWFYETNYINRLFYEDYIKLFHEHYYFIACETMYAEIDPSILSMLRKKYPKYKDFSTYGGSFLLKNLKE
jgi:SAM-dependent methyltransferase